MTKVQLEVLLGMDRGCRLTGSSLGKATLHDDPFTHDVHPQTHAALIRRGLVARRPRQPGDSMVCDWYLTKKGLEIVRQAKKLREKLAEGGN